MTISCTAATAQTTLTTLFTANIYGARGGMMYFDLTVNVPVSITALDCNLDEAIGTAGTIEFLTAPTTYRGKERDAAAWTVRGTGSIPAAAGANMPSSAVFATPVVLAPGTYGVALILSSGLSHRYTIGDGTTTPGPGTNQTYSTPEMTLRAGASNNFRFGGGLYAPRVWNGTIHYSTVVLTTFFSGTTTLPADSAFYFDLTANVPVVVDALDVNLSAPAATPGTVEFYTVPTTWFGHNGSSAGWTRLGTAQYTAAGPGLPSRATFASAFTLARGTWGVAIVYRAPSGQRYSIAASPQTFSTPELTLVSGGAGSIFSGVANYPRVWNGSIYYHGAAPQDATASNYGAGCYDQAQSFHELFGPGAHDLSNRAIRMVPDGQGYLVEAVVPAISLPPVRLVPGSPRCHTTGRSRAAGVPGGAAAATGWRPEIDALRQAAAARATASRQPDAAGSDAHPSGTGT